MKALFTVRNSKYNSITVYVNIGYRPYHHTLGLTYLPPATNSYQMFKHRWNINDLLPRTTTIAPEPV